MRLLGTNLYLKDAIETLRHARLHLKVSRLHQKHSSERLRGSRLTVKVSRLTLGESSEYSEVSSEYPRVSSELFWGSPKLADILRVILLYIRLLWNKIIKSYSFDGTKKANRYGWPFVFLIFFKD